MFHAHHSRANWIVTGCMLLMTAGCQTIPTEPIADTADPAEEITTTENQLKEIEKKQAHVVSPDYYDKAKSRLDDAKEMQAEGEPSGDILQKVAESRAYIKKARETTSLADEVIPEVMTARASAVAAMPPDADNKSLKDADDDLMDIGDDLEDGDTSTALKNRDKIKARYLDLELASIKDGYLGPIKSTRALASDEGAETSAPKSWRTSTNSLKIAETYLEENRDDKAGIQRPLKQAQMDADKLLKVSREAKALGTPNAEDMVLTKMSQDQALAAQRARTDAATSQLGSAERRMDSMETENQRLAAEKAFNDRFAMAQGKFDDEEAEVYRDENKLVLRLKSMAFLSGHAAVPAESFGLLNKVKEVVMESSPAMVVIEGHADSTGSPERNMEISKARADAVAEYLKRNGLDLSRVTLETRGMGDLHPIASNRTAEGRAQNRRVDVVIEPERGGLTH